MEATPEAPADRQRRPAPDAGCGVNPVQEGGKVADSALMIMDLGLQHGDRVEVVALLPDHDATP